MKSIFSKIADDPESDRYRILELNEEFLVMLSKNPLSKGHTLVIPVAQIADLGMYNNSSDFFSKTLEWAEKIKNSLNADAYILKINNQVYKIEEAGHVDHLHFHIIPRYKNDGGISNEMPPSAGADELKEVKAEIIGNL